MFSLLLRAHIEPLFCLFFSFCFSSFCFFFFFFSKPTPNGQSSLPIVNYPWLTRGLLHSHLLLLPLMMMISDGPPVLLRSYSCPLNWSTLLLAKWRHVNNQSTRKPSCALMGLSLFFSLHLQQNSGGALLRDASLYNAQWHIPLKRTGMVCTLHSDATL